MPWCPQCGGEYRKGIPTCSKCEVGLVAEMPQAARRHWRESAPPVGLALLGQTADALRHGLSAAKLAGRHPSLLLLAVVIAVVNVANRRLSLYVSMARQGLPAGSRTLWTPEKGWERSAPLLRTSELFQPMDAVQTFSSPIPAPSFIGAMWMAYESASGSRVARTRDLWLFLVVGIALILPVSTFVAAGYWRVVKEVVSGRGPRWESFFPGVRAYFVRLLVYQALLLVVSYVPRTLFDIYASGRTFASDWPLRLQTWCTWAIAPVVAFSVALVVTAVVNDDAGVVTGITRSLVVIYRRLLTALALLVMIGVLEFVVQWPVRAISYLLEGRLHGLDAVRALLIGMPLGMLLEAAYAAVGVWFLVAAFLWYRDASPRLWPRPVEAGPVVVAEA